MKFFCYVVVLFLLAGCTSTKPSHEIQSVQLVKSTETWTGQPLPVYPSGQPEVTIMRITLPPWSAFPMHTHPCINAGVLIKGQITVTTDTGRVLHLKPNEAIIETVDVWHYGRNDGDEPAEILVFYAGVKGGPISIKQHDAGHADHSHHAVDGK